VVFSPPGKEPNRDGWTEPAEGEAKPRWHILATRIVSVDVNSGHTPVRASTPEAAHGLSRTEDARDQQDRLVSR
jgi:hypothetical protein